MLQEEDDRPRVSQPNQQASDRAYGKIYDEGKINVSFWAVAE